MADETGSSENTSSTPDNVRDITSAKSFQERKELEEVGRIVNRPKKGPITVTTDRRTRTFKTPQEYMEWRDKSVRTGQRIRGIKETLKKLIP